MTPLVALPMCCQISGANICESISYIIKPRIESLCPLLFLLLFFLTLTEHYFVTKTIAWHLTLVLQLDEKLMSPLFHK